MCGSSCSMDVIQRGFLHFKSMSIYKHLGLDKLDCTVAIIKNARSQKMGKKDILKVECDINTPGIVINFDGYLIYARKRVQHDHIRFGKFHLFFVEDVIIF